MFKITIEGDLVTIRNDVASLANMFQIEAYDNETPEDVNEPAAPESMKQKVERKRRTKKSEVPAELPAEGGEAKPAETGVGTSDPITTEAQPAVPAKAEGQVTAGESLAPVAAPVPTLDDVKAALTRFMQAKKESPADCPQSRALLAKFDAASVTKIADERRAEFIKACGA